LRGGLRHLTKGTRVRVLRCVGYEYLVELEDRRGQLKHALIPSDAFSLAYRQAAEDTRKRTQAEWRDTLLDDEEAAEPIGTLADFLPELATWIERALLEAGETTLVTQVAGFAIRACWAGKLDNYNLSSLPREARPLVWGDRDRSPMRLTQPSGVPRRRWQVGVVSVRGKLLEIGVALPSVLRPSLAQMASRF
jgi:hypothetical protein